MAPALRARAEITHILARAPGGQMRGAATKSMSDIIEDRQHADTRPSPPRPFGLRPAGPLALLLAPHIRPGYSSSLAPCQRAWGPAAKCEFISARALSKHS